MYYKTFGLKEPPFQLTPDSRYLFFSKAHRRAKAYMDYAVWKRDGFIVLTGDIGAGKTTLINKLLSEIDSEVEIIRIFQTQLNEVEFIQAMLFELGINEAEIHGLGKVELLHKFNHLLIDKYSKGKHVVLIVDEGQNLTTKVLEEIRMLSGLELDQEKLLNIILVGQPEMNLMLDQPKMTQLVQRIRLRFHLGPLALEETIEYIKHRLQVAGSSSPDNVFDSEIYEEIQHYTSGIPRKLNVLCDTALVCAFADGKSKVDKETLHDALSELQWIGPSSHAEPSNGLNNEANTSYNQNESNKSPEYGIEFPDISLDDQQWRDIFSLMINIMTDVSVRMRKLDEKLERLSSSLNNRSDLK